MIKCIIQLLKKAIVLASLQALIKKLLLKLKVLAAKKEVPMNQIIEEALKHYYKL